MIFFSVIVPVYKAEDYIEMCIKSVLSQEYTCFELLLVDDGSPDSSPLICDLYGCKDKRVRVFHTDNNGVVKARQIGVENAKGEYLIFIDADDWIDATYLSEMAHLLVENEIDIICCASTWVYENKKILKEINYNGIYNRSKIESHIFPLLIENREGRYFSPTLWGKCFKKDIYITGQLTNCRVDIGEDGACVKATVYHANSIFFLNKPLYFYRQVESSVTKSKRAFDWNGPKLIAKHLERCIQADLFDFQAQIYRNLTHNLFNVVLSQFNRQESYRDIKLDILKNISDDYYQKAIKNSKYKNNIKGILAKITLQYRLIWPIYIFNKIKNRWKA